MINECPARHRSGQLPQRWSLRPSRRRRHGASAASAFRTRCALSSDDPQHPAIPAQPKAFWLYRRALLPRPSAYFAPLTASRRLLLCVHGCPPLWGTKTPSRTSPAACLQLLAPVPDRLLATPGAAPAPFTTKGPFITRGAFTTRPFEILYAPATPVGPTTPQMSAEGTQQPGSVRNACSPRGYNSACHLQRQSFWRPTLCRERLGARFPTSETALWQRWVGRRTSMGGSAVGGGCGLTVQGRSVLAHICCYVQGRRLCAASH